jgi:hypothetical protein
MLGVGCFPSPDFRLDSPPIARQHRACDGRFASGRKSILRRRVAGEVGLPSRAGVPADFVFVRTEPDEQPPSRQEALSLLDFVFRNMTLSQPYCSASRGH